MFSGCGRHPHPCLWCTLKIPNHDWLQYFTINKNGEIFELKAELNNEKKEKRKEAVKKGIAAMTVGKDVSSLFPDVN